MTLWEGFEVLAVVLSVCAVGLALGRAGPPGRLRWRIKLVFVGFWVLWLLAVLVVSFPFWREHGYVAVMVSWGCAAVPVVWARREAGKRRG